MEIEISKGTPCGINQPPMFNKVLNEFYEELAKMDDYSTQIYDSVNRIDETLELEPQGKGNEAFDIPVASKDVTSVLDKFIECVNRIRRYNSVLEKSSNGLRRLVG
jgi:hypothetical protein